jgi:hypothetical protein
MLMVFIIRMWDGSNIPINSLLIIVRYCKLEVQMATTLQV